MLLANLGYLFFLLNAKHIKLCARVLASFTSFFGMVVGFFFFFFFLGGVGGGFLHYGPSLAFPRLLDFLLCSNSSRLYLQDHLALMMELLGMMPRKVGVSRVLLMLITCLFARSSLFWIN